MRSGLGTLAFVLLLFGSACASGPEMGEINSMFSEACDLYEQSDFQSALERFEVLVSQGVEDAALYYNLANTYYKLGRRGEAVANYRRALMLSPRDDDARANLELLRSMTGMIDTTSSFSLTGIVDAPLEVASPRELGILAYAAYALASFAFLGFLFLGGEWRRRSLRGVLVLAAVAVISYALAIYGVSRPGKGDDGVVIGDEVGLMSGPGAAFEELTRLPGGTEVELRARSGIWIEVRLPTGEIGWLRQPHLEVI
jgi:tetratricopeptide (TPR) repeat protein